MCLLNKCKNLFIDFDGVIVDSNKFKEIAIEKSISRVIVNSQKRNDAINYFNSNAGISRIKKLSKFFSKKDISQIMHSYSSECLNFFKLASPTVGLVSFLKYIKLRKKNINIYILSGGEKNEIMLFLKKNNLNNFFEDILSSEKSKLDHLKNKQATKNDIFIGDSKNDLEASLQSGICFILFEGYKSLKSFPSSEKINEDVYIRTENFQTLINSEIL